MKVALERLSVLGPGLPDWNSARQAFRGETAYEPAPLKLPPVTLLPANEQRRLTTTTRMALGLALEACDGLTAESRTSLPSVFASAAGDSLVTDRLCTALASPGRPVSPTQFHNSVHNAPAGYWAIATGNQAASTSICAGEYTATAGLLEAATRCLAEPCRVLFVVYDAVPPDRLAPYLGVRTSFGMGLLLSSVTRPSDALCKLHLRTSTEAVTTLPSPWEDIRQANPAARNLGLLMALARSETAVVLPCSQTRQLAVDITYGD